MDENRIRQIIRQEMESARSTGRFGMNMTPTHYHTGLGGDGPRLSQDNIIPSVSVSGNITFSQVATYTINLNSSFTPSRIMAYGNVVGDAAQRYFSFGSANLTPSFYLQPENSTSVKTGTIQYPFVDPVLKLTVPLQSSAYFGAESNGGAMHTLSGEGHIVNIFYGAAVHARATVTKFSRSKIEIVVSSLDANWDINMNYVIS